MYKNKIPNLSEQSEALDTKNWHTSTLSIPLSCETTDTSFLKRALVFRKHRDSRVYTCLWRRWGFYLVLHQTAKSLSRRTVRLTSLLSKRKKEELLSRWENSCAVGRKICTKSNAICSHVYLYLSGSCRCIFIPRIPNERYFCRSKMGGSTADQGKRPRHTDSTLRISHINEFIDTFCAWNSMCVHKYLW